jgi:predicted transcriptional regulator
MADGYTRPLRESLIQLLATVMIPVSVAGTGLYYTRWQQNLNDLKTMIDLVSDQNAEKRKYGVAMFEYLLKNDKVPVEFVAAQLNYANSSSDKELLPLMEQALIKASAENPKVEITFRQALERMPSRVFVHTMNEQQRNCIRTLMAKMDDATRSTMVIPGYARATWGGLQNELRVFRGTDVNRGQDIVKALGDVGLPVELKDLSVGDGNAFKSRPNSFELWFGRNPLPASCGV